MAIFTVPPVTHALGVLFSSATALAAARLAGGLALAGYLLLLTPLYARLYGPDPHGGLGLLPSFVPAGLAAAAAAAAAAELWARPAASGAADRGCASGAKPRGARVVRRLCGAAGALAALCFFVPACTQLPVQGYGRSWDPAANGGREWWDDALMWLAFDAGVAAMAPLSLLCAPLSRASALARALGLPREQAVACHRFCARAALSLLRCENVPSPLRTFPL